MRAATYAAIVAGALIAAGPWTSAAAQNSIGQTGQGDIVQSLGALFAPRPSFQDQVFGPNARGPGPGFGNSGTGGFSSGGFGQPNFTGQPTQAAAFQGQGFGTAGSFNSGFGQPGFGAQPNPFGPFPVSTGGFSSVGFAQPGFNTQPGGFGGFPGSSGGFGQFGQPGFAPPSMIGGHGGLFDVLSPHGHRMVVEEVQWRLTGLGYNPGLIDGRDGPITRRAIRRYQADRGLLPDGRIDLRLLTALRHGV